MKFWIFNYLDAQKFQPKEPTLAIRIFDPDALSRGNTAENKLETNPFWIKELHYTFADVDPTIYKQDEPDMFNYMIGRKGTLNTHLASKLIKDFSQLKDSLSSVMIHCNAGISRSPATALALCHRFKITPEWSGKRAFFMKKLEEDFKLFGRAANMWVYSLLMEAD